LSWRLMKSLKGRIKDIGNSFEVRFRGSRQQQIDFHPIGTPIFETKNNIASKDKFAFNRAAHR
jgi:hypothetical protein